MEEKKATNEKDNFKERMDDINDKAQEFAKEAKERAGNFAEKTLEGVEKLIGDVFNKKNESKETDSEDESTDPKDVEIVELKKELDELRDKYVRLYADFDNFRKRNAKEKIELIQTASKDVIKELLPVIDDFERAQKALETSNDIKAVKEGMSLIYQKLLNNLSAKGLKAMDSIGKDFDVSLHEAVTEVPAKPEQEGKVIDELEKGYYLNDKIIRFAKVIVGKKS
jgi:molecular chaperone GrpE